MASRPTARLWATLGAAALLCSMVVAQSGPSIPVKYCASVNTASMSPILSDYQSQGRCFNNCTSLEMPLAIVQNKSCWCSNLVPSKDDQKPLKDCQSPCPGYPSDYCGGSGTFGYMQLSDPLGTANPGSDNGATSVRTVGSTKTLSPSVTAPTSADLDIVTPSASNEPPSTTPVVHTVTVGGVIRTVTATPSSTGGSTAGLATSQNSSGGLSTGATVGIAVGVIGVFAVGAIFLFMYCLKRKRREQQGEGLFSTSSRRGSSPGVLGTPKTGEVSEARFGDGLSNGPVWDLGQNSKRSSHLMPVDPRLDPFAKGIYVRNQNKSHDSIGSLQDNHDYSRRIQEPPRVLRAVNPDPDVD
ncbi:hypothetical protein OQA88_13083 [Cercophora sp. LCS_1]